MALALNSEAEDAGKQARPPRRSPLRRAVQPSAVLLSYLLLACLVYWPVSPLSAHTIIDCACSDPVQEVWFLNWTPWAVTHGLNPLFTDFLNAPQGANLAVNTSFPLLGLIAAPLTLTAGPLVSYNLLLRLALALSAGSMYWLLRRYSVWAPAAYAGGLLFGFSPYMIGHAHRHLFLTFVPLVPLIIAAVDNWLVRPRRAPYLRGTLVGLLTGLEFLISPEIALLTLMAIATGLLALAVRYRAEVRARLRPLATGLGPGIAALAIIAGPDVYFFLFGPQRPVGPLHSPASLYPFHANLAAPFVPTRGELIDPTTADDRFVNGSVVENGFYMGVPLLALVLFAAVRYRRKPLVLAATVAGVVAFVLGLGPTLNLGGGRRLTTMPFDLIAHLPALKNMEPARFSLFVQLSAAIVFAVALHEARAGRGAGKASGAALGRTTAAFVAALALLPLIPRVPLRIGTVRVPAFFTTSAVRTVAQDSLLLTYPYSISPHNDPMLWQSAAGMRFRIFGGDAFVPGPDGSSTWRPYPPASPDLRTLLGLSRARVSSQVLATRLKAFMRQYQVGGVVVELSAPGAGRVDRIVTAALHAPGERTGGVSLWLLHTG